MPLIQQCVLQCIGWLLGSHSMPSGEQLGTSLQCVNAVLQNRELCTVIGQTDHVTHVCSITSAVHHIVTSCKCAESSIFFIYFIFRNFYKFIIIPVAEAWRWHCVGESKIKSMPWDKISFSICWQFDDLYKISFSNQILLMLFEF